MRDLRIHLLCITVLILVFASPCPGEQAADDRSRELSALRDQLQHIESQLRAERKRLDKLNATVSTSSQTLKRLAGEAQQFQLASETKLNEVQALARQEAEKALVAQQHRQILATQLRAAQRMGDQQYLKLALNQDDPAALSRLLHYQRYLARAQAAQISEAVAELDQLAALRGELSREADQLLLDHGRSLARIHALELELELADQQRSESEAVVQATSEQIERLRAQEADLVQLLQNLQRDRERALAEEKQRQREAERREALAKTSEKPFAKLVGKLAWPVQGRVVRGFGASHNSGDFRSRGVLLGAEPGTKVRSIAAGRVLFAGEFKHLGLLVIVDHGQSWMSLYGYNASLYVKEGQDVEAGSLLGDTGAALAGDGAALYFEVRQSGKPVNPARWCKLPGGNTG